MRPWRWLIPLCASLAAEAQVTLMQSIESALARNPRLAVEREQVLMARSRILQASSLFDPQLGAQLQQARANVPLTGLQRFTVISSGLSESAQSSNQTTGLGSANVLLRSGLQLSSSLNLSRSTDNLAQRQGVNLSQLRFQAAIPLLRGRGRAIVAAEESAAGIETEASLYDLNHTASTLIADTASRYWELAAAELNVQVLQEAEDRGQVLVETVRTLIEADRMPRAELQQVLANLATRIANRAAGEQRLTNAMQALELAMGLGVEELRRVLKTGDALPDGETARQPSMGDAELGAWIGRSLERRADYLNLRRRQGAIEVRQVAARDRLRPQLDLKFSTGYSGLNEGRRPDRLFHSPFTNAAGVDLSGGIEYNLPLGRHAARAQVDALVATSRQNQYSTQDLGRSIASSVLAAVAAYRSAIIRAQQARQSVDASRAALDGEREKLRLGVGSVVDLLTIEDRLNQARSAYIDATLNYAVLLTRIRFATGTFIDPQQSSHTVSPSIFLRPPWEDSTP